MLKMNVTWKTCMVAAVALVGMAHPAAAVEELAAPANAVADDVIAAEGIPASPYDVVPYELDPAVELYSDSVPMQDVTAYSPAYEAAPQWSVPHYHAASVACCVPPKIRYWNHPLLASAVCPCNCNQTIDTHISVPCQCCPVMVKVCLPVCCSGAPHCEAGRDLLGRKTYDYCWPCGYRIKIVDRHTGTLVVHTFDR